MSAETTYAFWHLIQRKTEKFFKNIAPPPYNTYEILLTVRVARLDIKLQWEGDPVSKAGAMFLEKNFSVFRWMQC